jgi:hypothetical protein
MEHVVFYPSAEGVPAFERVESLDAAVSFVEQLRNSMNITEFSVHALTPVPLSFRAYYHVEVPTDAAPVSAPDEDRSAAWVAEAAFAEPSRADIQPAEVEPSAEMAADPSPAVDEEPVAAAVGADVVPEAGGRKSMGFFTR